MRFIKHSHLVKTLMSRWTGELSTYVIKFQSKGFLVALDNRHLRHSVSDLHAVDVSCRKPEHGYSPAPSAMSVDRAPYANYEALCDGQSYPAGDGLHPWFELEKSGMKMFMDETESAGLAKFRVGIGIPMQLRCKRPGE